MLQKIIDKYKGLSSPVKASFWFLICGFLQKAIAMITTPVFTRIMTEAEYGRYSVYYSWYNIITIITTLNLSAGVYTRGLVKNEEDQERFSSSLLGLSTTCIVLFSLIYIAFHGLINDLLNMNSYLMSMMLIDIWANCAFLFWSNKERVAYRYRKLVLITGAFTVIRPVMEVIAVMRASYDIQVEARVTAVVLVNIIFFIGLAIGIVKAGKCYFDWRYWKYALTFNLPLIPHYLSQIVLNQSDKIMISNICGSVDAAYYSVAYSISIVMLIFNNAVSSTMNPWIYRCIKEKKYKKIGYVSYSVLITIALINLALISVAPELLVLLAPASYRTAVWIIPPVTASVYFMFLYNLFATFEYYYEKTRWVMIASLSGAILNIVLNAVFIPIYGFIAAGYTTLACYILYSLAHYFFMKKVCKQYMDGEKIYDLKMILIIGISLIVLSVFMMILYNYIWIRYTILGVGIVIVIMQRKHILALFAELKK